MIYLVNKYRVMGTTNWNERHPNDIMTDWASKNGYTIIETDSEDIKIADFYEDKGVMKLKPNDRLLRIREERAEQLRLDRDIICFPIINRGTIWYNDLTAEQVAALTVWYEAWKALPNQQLQTETKLEHPIKPDGI